jgi:transposase
MLPSGVKIWVAVEPVNMKKSFDGLAVLAQEVLSQNVMSGHLFVFRNKNGDKLKVLYWDRNGFAQWYKRLEQGVFRFPRIQDAKRFTLTVSELSLLLEGIDLTQRRFESVFQSAVN